MSLRDQLIKTAEACVSAHGSLSVEAVRAICSPDLKESTSPSSLNSTTKNFEEYMAFCGQIFPMFHEYNIKTLQTVVDEEQRKVVSFLRVNATADAGEYQNEYIISMTMTDDGKLVKEQNEFVDSYLMMEWLKKMVPGGAPATEGETPSFP